MLMPGGFFDANINSLPVIDLHVHEFPTNCKGVRDER